VLRKIKLLLSLVLLAVPAFAQSTSAILSGTVLDSSEARIPGVQISLKNVNTDIVLTNVTNEAGVYTFPSVQPGTYQLTAEAPGFQTYVLNEIIVEVAARMNINVPLQVAGVSAAVEVTAAPDSPLLASTASVGGVINGRELLELPLPDRDALGLVFTQPGLYGDNFGGSRISSLNVVRDGINVMDPRINTGVSSVIFPSVDVIQEVRVITSPADAELGRGSGQVQVLTRSGTSEFHGSLYEFQRNTALNANDWFNNMLGEPRNQLVLNQFGGRLGGPIVRQRTFFHFTYEGQRERDTSRVTAGTYTQTARDGIFRFYPGVQNGNANAPVPTVDVNGNPVRPVTATGPLQAVSLFGRDPNRRGPDPTGTVQKVLRVMPLPNDFRFGDGLNIAGYTWRRKTTNDLNQYNLRIDHTLSSRHQLTSTWTRQNYESKNGFMAQPFPQSPAGLAKISGDFFSFALNSTLSSSMVNEFRAGTQRGHARFYAPWELPGGRDLMPSSNGSQYLTIFLLAADPIPASESDGDPQGRVSPLYVFGDTFHWNKGKHALKFGGEQRFASTNGFNSFNVMPRVTFGFGDGPALTGVNSSSIPGLGLNEGIAQALLLDMAGSVDNVLQAFNASPGANPIFFPGEGKQRTWRQREFSTFFQDDFNLKPSMTLNLGLRYEFYGVPWEANGKAAGLIGGSTGLFGISGSSWSDLYQPGSNKGSLTRVQLIGPKSPNPNTGLYAEDFNNFAPVVGFSWSIPYFGKDTTILRAGYSVSYERNALRLTDIVSGDEPGLRTESLFTSESYLDLTRIRLPLQPAVQPLETVPVTDRAQTVRAFDNNLRTPYVQNWNLTIQRALPGNFTLDVRYAGSKGTKLLRTVNLNEVNIFENGILDAFKITQGGGNAPLFDRLFNSFNLGLGPIDGRTITGSASLRVYPTTRGYLANNDVGAFADFVNRVTADGQRGGVLRIAGLPENWIVANPQFAAANLVGNFANSTYHSFQLSANRRFSNGWTLNSNYTWSRTLGEEEGSSQDLLNSYRNGRDRKIDKRLLGFHRTHIFRNSGSWELPFGNGHKFLSGNGVLPRLLGGWQIGGIFNLFSGAPIGLSAQVSSFNQFVDNTPVLVGPLAKSAGKVKRTDNGVVYFDGFTQTPDPAISGLTSAQLLSQRSTLKAIVDPSGKLIAVNPVPGTLGSMSQTYLEGPGAFRFDMNLLKHIRIREGIEFILRADAINVLNSPQFGNPNTDINSTSFGRILSADGNRIVVLSARLNF
jgi:carboxypeptidase family protein